MEVITEYINLDTIADGGIHNITDRAEEKLKKSKLKDGIATFFCVGSTASISTIEYEPGLKKDLPKAMEKIAPKDIKYYHHDTWHDDNGRSHVKATIMGPSLVVPFVDANFVLGTWQQIVLIEWDTKGRKRKVVMQIMGE